MIVCLDTTPTPYSINYTTDNTDMSFTTHVTFVKIIAIDAE